MQFKHVLFLSTFVLLISCKSSKQHTWSELPEVTKIGTLQQTEFVPTLESPIQENKNVVYAAAFLYAWDKVRQDLKTPITLDDKNSNGFKLVNQSTSFENTLRSDEYSVEVDTSGDEIIAKAFFNKTLPLPSMLQKLEKPISFDHRDVSGFGMQSYEPEIANFTRILFYKDDDHFVLQLTPKDSAHQIMLVKGLDKAENLFAAVQQTNQLIRTGNQERTTPKTSWKYTLNDIDIFSIPSIKFNIATNYSDIEGQNFKTGAKSHRIQAAYQRTGFILNENGAVVESEAFYATDSSSSEPIKILPKRMVFDKPFFVIVKRSNSDNPYFVMYVQNTELLTKE